MTKLSKRKLSLGRPNPPLSSTLQNISLKISVKYGSDTRTSVLQFVSNNINRFDIFSRFTVRKCKFNTSCDRECKSKFGIATSLFVSQQLNWSVGGLLIPVPVPVGCASSSNWLDPGTGASRFIPPQQDFEFQ